MEQEANEDGTPEVFRNKVVLREIFKYLPTSTLISSCSLVNKLWREETRSFIQDYRECTVQLGSAISGATYQDKHLWTQLWQLGCVLEEMDTIPFNSIRVFVNADNNCCGEEAVWNELTNLTTRFPLKYLTVIEDLNCKYCRHPGLCKARDAILELVKVNSCKLLELESLVPLRVSSCGFFENWTPRRFEKLKKLTIAESSSITPNCAKEIIGRASNLRAIVSNCRHMIPDVIPENMYGTLKRLAFAVGDVDRIESFANKLDQLEELLVDFGSGRSDENAMQIRCVALFHKLLELNNSTLCRLGIRCTSDEEVTLFNKIHLLLLPSVIALSIDVRSVQSLVHISALNFRECLPNLRNVDIKGFSGTINNYADANMVPEEDAIVAPNASVTTLELNIRGKLSTSDLATLRSVFPNVVKLSFLASSHLPLIGLIGIMWPHLQSLSIRHVELEEEIGTQVCGLHPQEWRLLRQQDTEFLKCVQVVPRGPCLFTMRELKHFQLEYKDRSDLECEALRQLVELLVIGRMPALSVKVNQQPVDYLRNVHRMRDLFEQELN